MEEFYEEQVTKQQDLLATPITAEEVKRVSDMMNDLGTSRLASIVSRVLDTVGESLALDMKVKEFAAVAGAASAFRGISQAMSPYNFIVTTGSEG